MYIENKPYWLKHLDFIFIDMLMFICSLFISNFLYLKSLIDFDTPINRLVIILFVLGSLITSLILVTQQNILSRGLWKEFRQVVIHDISTTLLVIFGLFIIKVSSNQSRAVVGLTFIFFLILDYIARIIWKKVLLALGVSDKNNKSLLIITSKENASNALSNIFKHGITKYTVDGLVIYDCDMKGEEIDSTSVVANLNDVHEYALNKWIDEVLIDVDIELSFPQEVIDRFLEMGIVVNRKLYVKKEDVEWQHTVSNVGQYTVVTSSINKAKPLQIVVKRIIDIVGALVGLFFTGLIYLYYAPKIKKESPGPVFYNSTRIGKNGKTFKMYKFRSMYLDADDRKAELAKLNRVADGLMFKIEFDPRIIGNKVLEDGTQVTGIGQFIRKTSLDEFPQFLNVLKGEMSLVGTRPPTPDEWVKYELHHRSRMAIKPGITGMWQVSGRSEITDFEEVVRLDREYISKWSLGLDFKILFLTVWQVIARKGSM